MGLEDQEKHFNEAPHFDAWQGRVKKPVQMPVDSSARDAVFIGNECDKCVNCRKHEMEYWAGLNKRG